MYRHKTRKPPNRNSVFLAQEQWQYSGNAYRRLSQLPEHIIEELSGGSGIPEIVTELDQFSVQLESEDELCLENLKTLLGNLMNFEPRRSQDDASSDEEQNKYAAQFHEHGGIDVLLRILMFNTHFPQTGKKVGYSETELLLRIKSLVLEILTKITTTNVGEKVTKQLMENDDVLNYVFTLLAHQKTFINSCQLIEDLLQSSREVLDLQFHEHGGIDVLLRILMFNTHFPQTGKKVGYSETELLLRIKSLVLEILTKITTTNVGEKVTKQLMENDDVLNYVFTLLAHQKTFINSCQLIEDLLQSSREVLDLHRIQNVRGLISCLNDQQLANFCRILAVAISDLDIYENKSSLFAQNKQKRSKGFINIRDINQELLLGIPELLPRLVNLAVAKDYTPRYRGMVSELDCWMEWIENQMAEEMYDLPTVDDLDDFIGGISEPTSAGGPMNVQQGLKITEELVQRVEVVYVLGLFLLGKHRKKVQRKLAELKLAPGLSELFDQFIWKCQVSRYSSRHRLRGHNAACECSPEVALKIQFLRLVHSFCDHSDYKHLLLSKNELNEVKRINTKAGTLALSNLENVNKTLMCKGSEGLLTKIVEVMKKEPTTSTFRFWLARAVESYLRGNTSYCDQVFLMRRGLLQHVATNIVEHEIRHKEILQSSFDLLGELIKFNIEAFKSFEEILSTQPKFDKFVNTVNRNLVDSNMFIRSLVLSLEHFYNNEAENMSSSTEKQEKLPEKQFRNDYAKKDNKLLMYIGDFNRQLDYLYKLIKIINVQNLTQENVSCLNTTLVFLMFANRKSQLPRYLRALRDEKEDMLDVSGSAGILRNFRDLLVFWQDHYLHKDKDCSALEKSSKISFDYWKQTVSLLVSDDKEEPSGILHYIQQIPCDRPN